LQIPARSSGGAGWKGLVHEQCAATTQPLYQLPGNRTKPDQPRRPPGNTALGIEGVRPSRGSRITRRASAFVG
jgi:hypothetical protein